MTARTASCACGSLRIACAGPPRKVSLCHCLDCQRRTGSAFGIAAFYARADTTPDGASRTWTRTADNGHQVTHHFCPGCGSTVFWYPTRMPTLVAVAVGAFADPTFPAPQQAVFPHQRHLWVQDPS